MGVMVLINIPVIAVLSRPAAAALRNYTEQRKVRLALWHHGGGNA